MSVLSLENICFSYDETPVLYDLSMSFEKGKIYCIVGKTGAGKTTLLSILSGLACQTAERYFITKMTSKIQTNTHSEAVISVWCSKAII